jgi:hypothetical protein
VEHHPMNSNMWGALLGIALLVILAYVIVRLFA